MGEVVKDGNNYLIPTDAVLETDTDVYDEASQLDRVLVTVEPAKQLRLVILDACRDNPFAKTMKRTIAPKLGQPAPRITSTLSLVSAGLGIAVIPSTMQSVQISGIVYRRLRPPVPRAFLGLAFRRDDPSPVLKQFVSVVRSIAKSSPAIQ